MKVRYTPEALKELRDILDRIALQSPRGARRVRSRFQAIARLLREQSLAGHIAQDGRTRRFDVVPFAVFYEIDRTDVVVIAVRHAARDPAGMPGR